MHREASGLPESTPSASFTDLLEPPAEPNAPPPELGATGDGRLGEAAVVYDVLVVDDELDIRVPLVAKLADEGFHVIGAENGEDALQYPTARVVVTDLSMPRIGGVELVRKLRAAGYDPGVVLMSGARNIHEIGREEGADASFRKPFEMLPFLRTVSRLVGESMNKHVA